MSVSELDEPEVATIRLKMSEATSYNNSGSLQPGRHDHTVTKFIIYRNIKNNVNHIWNKQ